MAKQLNSGIYALICDANNKLYVGSAVRLSSRRSNHFRNLIKNTHPCRHLQNAWNKYGNKHFHFEIIEHILPNKLLTTEQKWLDHYWDTGRLFNTRRIAHSNYGIKSSQQTKDMISIFQKRRASTKEGREQIQSSLSKAAMVRWSPKAAEKRINSLRIWATTDDARKHLAKIQKLSKSVESIKKLSASMKKWSTTNEGRVAIQKANAASTKSRRVLTKEQVNEIMVRISHGECRKRLAVKFKVSKETIRRVATHKYCLFVENTRNENV